MREKVKSPQRDELKQLIVQAGGEEEFTLILRDFYTRMHSDVMIGFFFTGKDLNHIVQQQAQFIFNAAGLTDRFDGKGPTSAHLDLPPILSGHFDRRLVILKETLTAHSIAPEWTEKWIRFEESFRKLIVSET